MQRSTIQLSISFVNVVQNLKQSAQNMLPQYSYLPPAIHNLSPSLWHFRVEELVLNKEAVISAIQLQDLQQNLLFGAQAQEILQKQLWCLQPFYESERRRFVIKRFSFEINILLL